MSRVKPWEEDGYQNAVAIVGMAGQFRSAPTLEHFWNLVCRGGEAIFRLDEVDLAAAGCPESVSGHPSFVPVTGQLDRAEGFDADFFGFTPADALDMDPQLRLLLQNAWHAFENAGMVPGDPRQGLVGVFTGAAPSLYWSFNLAPSALDHLGTGFNQRLITTDPGFFATWIAHKLDLRGPAFSLASACSTGLAVVASACQHLLDYSCDAALAAAASVFSPRGWGMWAETGGILSPDGHCRPFDAGANGTVMGEGVCSVVLKRLGDAIEQGDDVKAVIRGCAVNNDGARKVGYTAPSVAGQAEVIRMAQAAAGIAPDGVGYVETHGTGTILGDPIEFEGLCEAFGSMARRRSPCLLGSLKANFGHLNVAAGMASLIKTALMLRDQRIPPLVNFSRPNPELKLDGSPFALAVSGGAWPEDLPRVAGISSFGFGGTNCHAVLERAPDWASAARPAPPGGDGRCGRAVALPFSAPDRESLGRQVAALARFLEERPEVCLADVATALLHKKHWPWRAVLLGGDRGVIARRLAEGAYLEHGPVETRDLGVHCDDFSLLPEERLRELLKDMDDCWGADNLSDACMALAGPSGVGRKGSVLALSFAFGIRFVRRLRRSGLHPSVWSGEGIGGLVAAWGRESLSEEETVDRLRRLVSDQATNVQTGDVPARRDSSCSRSDKSEPLMEKTLLLRLEVGRVNGNRQGNHQGNHQGNRQTDALPLLAGGEECARHACDGKGSPEDAWQQTLADLYLRGIAPGREHSAMHPSCIPPYAFAETSYWRPLAETAANAPVRDNLPEPGEEREDGADPAETLLLDIWREALGVPGLTAEDDFLRLGGNSMTAIRIIADIESRLGVSVSVAAFMRARTVGNLILEIADNM